jgi:hypothetical protein
MLSRQKIQLGSLALLVSLCSFSMQTRQNKDISDRAAVVTWSADLNGKNETPAVSTEARAKAEFMFDFQTQTAKFRMTGENLRDVSKVLLLAKGPQTNLKGAPVLTLYNAGENPALPKAGAYTKTFTDGPFKEIANAVLNGTGVIEVTTKAHPNGEIAGLVQMHKSYQ